LPGAFVVEVGTLAVSPGILKVAGESRTLGESTGDEDKHKALTHPHIRPLSLQDGDDAGYCIRLAKFIRTGASVSRDNPIRIVKFIRTPGVQAS
jgi:hypothetical protein